MKATRAGNCGIMSSAMAHKNPEISNKQVFRDYIVEKTFEAGLVLFGNEVKSLRDGEANLKGSFARIDKSEIFLYNFHISPYMFTRDEQDPLRPKKLLLSKSEIRHIDAKISQKGYALVPIKVYFKRSFAKVELALAKGKKLYDKRDDIKKKEVEREMKQESRRRR